MSEKPIVFNYNDYLKLKAPEKDTRYLTIERISGIPIEIAEEPIEISERRKP